MNQAEVKQYVIDTINKGDRVKIQKVLKRYYEYLNENKTDDVYEWAKKNMT